MIVVDVETGGLNPKEHALLSIGAVDTNNLDEFYAEIKPFPGKICDSKALEINGLWNYSRHENELQEAMKKFKAWVWGRELPLAGHNPSFDLGFLDESFKITNVGSPFGYRTVDLHSVAYAYCKVKGINPPKLTSDNIYTLLGMPQEPRPHNAFNGALWEATAFLKIFKALK